MPTIYRSIPNKKQKDKQLPPLLPFTMAKVHSQAVKSGIYHRIWILTWHILKNRKELKANWQSSIRNKCRINSKKIGRKRKGNWLNNRK